jgi:DNA-binding response OmpR family regulator
MSNSKKRILLVDDEPDITFALGMGLEDNGFIVDTFNDPLLALQAFKEKKRESYALALIDVKMPEMNGFELYNEIRKIDDKVKVCFITAFDIQKADLKLNNSEKYDLECLIRKPVSIDDLVKRLKAEIY